MGKKKAPTEPQKTDSAEKKPEANPRRALFDMFYRNGGPNFGAGNAFQSAIAAGYSPATAKSNCHLLACESRVRTAEALEALGCDGFSQAQKLLHLREAKTVKWNPSKQLTLHAGGKGKRVQKIVKGGWDTFEDGDLQLRAAQEINKIQGAYPDPERGGDGRSVQIIFPASFAGLAEEKPAGS
jgi:hypothetical protein